MIPIQVVAGILQQDNKILVAQRPPGKPYSGFWEFPGGKIEQNELGEHALRRELYEELGIEVNAAELLFHHEYTYPDKIIHLQVWFVIHFSGTPHSKENQALQWVSMSEMCELNLLEGNWPIVNKLKQQGIP